VLKLHQVVEQLVKNGAPGAIVVVRTPSGVRRAAAGLARIRPRVTMAPSDRFLERHAALRSASTIRTLRHRLRPLDAYGAVTLHELEGMGGDLADFRATLPPRFAHDVMRALRQTLAATVRYGYMRSNPAVAAGDNPAPKPRAVRAYTLPSSMRSRPSWARPTARRFRSPPPPGCDRLSGRDSNAATSTGHAAC
jgi:hypothetical protein